jgi:hypothetical protein
MKFFFVSRNFKLTFSVIVFFVLVSQLCACAYKLSNKVDKLPGDIKILYVPVFKNLATETLVESYFTDSMRSEILRSGYAKLVDTESAADAVIYGTVESVEITTDEIVTESKYTEYLPKDSVLSLGAKIKIDVAIELRKKGSTEVLWNGHYTQSSAYTPPQLTLPTINSANNLYNQSARRSTMQTMSKEMMQLAFDRMVDNF